MPSKKCFIICPISTEGTEVRKNSDLLMKHIIEKSVSSEEYEIIRIDQKEHNNSITQEIIKYLIESDLVIADISGHNPNCFYEIGYRHATKKPIIFLKNKDEKIPFDISDIRTIEYDLTDLDSVDITKNSLLETINNIKPLETNSLENEKSDYVSEKLTKIITMLSNIDGKILNSNSEIIHQKETMPKTENEVMMNFLETMLSNPEQMKNFLFMMKKLDK